VSTQRSVGEDRRSSFLSKDRAVFERLNRPGFVSIQSSVCEDRRSSFCEHRLQCL
jgi:hypothetical protein